MNIKVRSIASSLRSLGQAKAKAREIGYPDRESQPLQIEDGGPKSQEDEWSNAISREFIAGGVNYFASKTVGQVYDWMFGLKKVPQFKLERPVLFVQGFAAPVGQFETALTHLTKDGANGGEPVYIKEGKFFSDPECKESTEVNSENKVFRMVHDPFSTPDQTAQQMKLATGAMARATGSDLPDVIAHSLGGLGARRFCDLGNKIGKLAMVGTPNQGARVSMVTKSALVNGISWATTMAGVSAAAIPALEWMVPVLNGNERLETLNDRWEIQEANTQGSIVLGATSYDTPSSTAWEEPGDALIEASALEVGDAQVKTFDGGGAKCHYTMVSDPEIFTELASFFDWKAETPT